MTQNNRSKRVLIVDDEPNLPLIMAAALENLGDEYEFDLAYDGFEALDKIQQGSYVLLITDHNMPGMTGLDLAQATRHISPDTRVIMMTAFSTDNLRQMIKQLNLDGFIEKPAPLDQVQEIVKDALKRVSHPGLNKDFHPAVDRVVDEAVNKRLQSLRANTGARCILLLSAEGYPINVVGQSKELDITGVSTLVAANFMAASELANMLGRDSSIFKSSYYEGNDYNIYSYDINGDWLLVVIFDEGSKPGTVWFYTKKIAAELSSLAENHALPKLTFTEDDMSAAIDSGFETLFDSRDEPDTPPANTGRTGPDKLLPQPTVKNASALTFEQAVAAGLVPKHLVEREQNGASTNE